MYRYTGHVTNVFSHLLKLVIADYIFVVYVNLKRFEIIYTQKRSVFVARV